MTDADSRVKLALLESEGNGYGGKDSLILPMKANTKKSTVSKSKVSPRADPEWVLGVWNPPFLGTPQTS